jgi:hypothetical protein
VLVAYAFFVFGPPPFSVPQTLPPPVQLLCIHTFQRHPHPPLSPTVAFLGTFASTLALLAVIQHRDVDAFSTYDCDDYSSAAQPLQIPRTQMSDH